MKLCRSCGYLKPSTVHGWLNRRTTVSSMHCRPLCHRLLYTFLIGLLVTSYKYPRVILSKLGMMSGSFQKRKQHTVAMMILLSMATLVTGNNIAVASQRKNICIYQMKKKPVNLR